MHEQEKEVMGEYSKTQTAEKEFIQKLQDTYGLGTLNIGEGEFIPAPKAETVATTTTTETTTS